MAEDTPEPTAKRARKPRARAAAAGTPAPGIAAPQTETAPVTAPEPALAGVPEPAPESPPEPVPLAVPLEEQINDLPPLSYPGTDNQEFQKWADERRSRRVRVEIVGAVVLLVGGAISFMVTGNPTTFVIAVFAVLALAAYEFLVNSFE